jgi:hypothetical protein
MFTPKIRKFIPGSTISDEGLQRSLKWIGECSTYHKQCNKSQDSMKLPTRVLELSLASVRLLESENVEGPYACLSHCWGTTGTPLVTTKKDLPAFKTDIPLSRITKTFFDAIMFTLRLGIRYLWIDSLCIIQDDPMDWEREAANMADIYSNALVTLAAATSPNAHGGLFTRQDEFVPPPRKIATLEMPSGEILPVHAYYSTLHNMDIDWYPLNTRAWVLQERLLSPRTIHFAGPELLWECKEQSTCECEAAIHYSHTKRKASFAAGLMDLDPSSLAQIWQSTVSTFTHLNITYGKDIFPAFSGIARQWAKAHADTYLAGLWKSTMIDGLLWRAGPKVARQALIRARPWRAPT